MEFKQIATKQPWSEAWLSTAKCLLNSVIDRTTYQQYSAKLKLAQDKAERSIMSAAALDNIGAVRQMLSDRARFIVLNEMEWTKYKSMMCGSAVPMDVD